MEGLGVPLFGGYTSYQTSGSTASSAYLVVNADGTHDFSWADEGADNYISLTITDATTITSGYIQPFYTSLSVTGAYSTGSTQINAFAADISLSGTPGVEVAGVYIYISETGTTTVTSLNLNGMVVYLEEMGGSVGYRAGFKAYSDDDSIATSLDAAFVSVSANSGLWGAMLGHKGAQYPEYFLWCQNAPTLTKDMCVTYTPGDTAGHALRVSLAGTIYNIPMVADSCS